MTTTPNGFPALPEVRRIDPAPLERSLSELERTRLELGTTPAMLIAERIEDARTELMEAMKLADRHGASEAHVHIGQIVLAVDDLRTLLVGEREAMER